MANSQATIEKISAWAKRKGFVYPASDIYGGMANTYDYGPYGTQLKQNLQDLWWRKFIKLREDVFGIDSTVILRPEIWEASGHTDSFADVMVEDKVSNQRYRADHLIEDQLEKLDDRAVFDHSYDLAKFVAESYGLTFTYELSNNPAENLLGVLILALAKGTEEIKSSIISNNSKINLELIPKNLTGKTNIDIQTLKNFITSSEPKPSFEEVSYIKGFMDRKADGLPIKLIIFIIELLGIKSPNGNPLSEPKRFNQLFQTEVGIIAGEKNKAYLRGEIAQGLFLNFKNIRDSLHPKLPFGIGQVGKAFRNEITPGKFTYRTLEFDLMEFEYFFDSEQNKWEEVFEYWKKEMYQFALDIGISSEHLRWREHEEFERSHYSKRTEDLEYKFPWGFKEMWGLAYRTDFDLKNHMEKSGKDLSYIYPDGKKVLPHVVEPTFGLSRTATILMFEGYKEQELENGKQRTVMQFDPKIAPIQAAIFPLQKDEKLRGLAKDIYTDIREQVSASYADTGNIGQMYRRNDEIGTPYCVTVDFDSLEDKQVTIRERDTMEQRRVPIAKLVEELALG